MRGPVLFVALSRFAAILQQPKIVRIQSRRVHRGRFFTDPTLNSGFNFTITHFDVGVPGPIAGAGLPGPDLGWRWRARLVEAAESEDSLIPLANRERRNTASGYFVHEPEQISLTPIWRRRRAFLRTSTKEY